MKARYWGIPIYFDPQTNELKGRNALCDFLLDMAVWLDANVVMPFFGIDDFAIEIEGGK